MQAHLSFIALRCVILKLCCSVVEPVIVYSRIVTSYHSHLTKMKSLDLPVTSQELKFNCGGAFPLSESKSDSLWFNPKDRSFRHSSLINSSMSFNCCSSSGSKAKRLILSKAMQLLVPEDRQKFCVRFFGRKSYLSFKRSELSSR